MSKNSYFEVLQNLINDYSKMDIICFNAILELETDKILLNQKSLLYKMPTLIRLL